MNRPIDLGRARRALAALDALVTRFPWLTRAGPRKRLAKALDDTKEESDRGRNRDGDEEN